MGCWSCIFCCHGSVNPRRADFVREIGLILDRRIDWLNNNSELAAAEPNAFDIANGKDSDIHRKELDQLQEVYPQFAKHGNKGTGLMCGCSDLVQRVSSDGYVDGVGVSGRYKPQEWLVRHDRLIKELRSDLKRFKKGQ